MSPPKENSPSGGKVFDHADIGLPRSYTRPNRKRLRSTDPVADPVATSRDVLSLGRIANGLGADDGPAGPGPVATGRDHRKRGRPPVCRAALKGRWSSCEAQIGTKDAQIKETHRAKAGREPIS